VIVQEKLSWQRFRELYGGRKPAFELIGGIPEQKALSTTEHSFLQTVLIGHAWRSAKAGN